MSGYCAASGRNRREKLNDELQYLQDRGVANYDLYKSHVLNTNKYTGVKIPIVYITEAQQKFHNQIENKTKPEIIRVIKALLAKMTDRNELERFNDDLTKLEKYGEKQELLDVYNEVNISLEAQSASQNYNEEAEH